jgi:hypothetical protein
VAWNMAKKSYLEKTGQMFWSVRVRVRG